MANKPKVHCPRPKSPGLPFCNSPADEPPIAEPDGHTIDCKACLRMLHDRAQYYHILLEQGYRFPSLSLDPLKKGRKADPRQTGFMFE